MDTPIYSRLEIAKQVADDFGMEKTSKKLERLKDRIYRFKNLTDNQKPISGMWLNAHIEETEATLHKEEKEQMPKVTAFLSDRIRRAAHISGLLTLFGTVTLAYNLLNTLMQPLIPAINSPIDIFAYVHPVGLIAVINGIYIYRQKNELEQLLQGGLHDIKETLDHAKEIISGKIKWQEDDIW